MKLSTLLVGSVAVATNCAAFSLHPHLSAQRLSQLPALSASTTNNDNNNAADWKDQVGKLLATGLITASIWAAPNMIPTPSFVPDQWNTVASAKEMASGSGSRVNKDPESLLRYGLPIDSPEARKLQKEVEAVKTDIGSKRKSAALDHVRAAKRLMADPKLVPKCRDATICTETITKMSDEIGPLSTALQDSQSYQSGSEQERGALDRAYKSQITMSKLLTTLQEQMVPSTYENKVPEDYSDLPQLEKRATVEMLVRKADKSPFDVNGQNYPEAKMTMIIDGYSSPVTGGNFIDLVKKGFYNNMPIQRSDGFVVQTGDPEGEADGYVGTPGKAVGAGKHGERLIPLEIFVKGDKAPTYEETIEEAERGGEATTLPFSAYGAMGWARQEYEDNTGSSQFFWLLFDSDLTPAGKNVLDGNYPCFGYVVEGEDFLRDMKEGDIIVSAKVTEGASNLKQGR